MFTGKHMVAAFDLLCCIMIVLVLQQGHAKPPHIQTFGKFAVTASWAAGSNNDVDLYVRDPNGNICYFAAMTTGLMTLGGDDLGTATTGTATLPDGRTVRSTWNGERTLIRGIVPGEYTVDVHMYRKNQRGSERVTIQLWALRGSDVLIKQVTVTLRTNGDDITGFRFTLDAAGRVSNINTLPAHLADRAVAAAP